MEHFNSILLHKFGLLTSSIPINQSINQSVTVTISLERPLRMGYILRWTLLSLYFHLVHLYEGLPLWPYTVILPVIIVIISSTTHLWVLAFSNHHLVSPPVSSLFLIPSTLASLSTSSLQRRFGLPVFLLLDICASILSFITTKSYSCLLLWSSFKTVEVFRAVSS